MLTLVACEQYIKPIITFQGTCLAVVESFAYLESTSDGSLGTEIPRIQKVSVANGILENGYGLIVILLMRLKWMFIDSACWVFFLTHLKHKHCFVSIWKYLSTFIRSVWDTF